MCLPPITVLAGTESFCGVGRECRSLLILVWPPHRRRSCPAPVGVGRFVIRATRERGVGVPQVGAWRGNS
jgi:hypothetical protein